MPQPWQAIAQRFCSIRICGYGGKGYEKMESNRVNFVFDSGGNLFGAGGECAGEIQHLR